MIKLFTPKQIDKVTISGIQDKKLNKEIHQAKGVINNFLKDKHYKVTISESQLRGNDYLDVKAFSDSKKSRCAIPVKKDGDDSVLRRIYKVIDLFAKDYGINRK